MMERLKKLRSQMKRRELDALLVTHLPHVRYLCGFSGSAGQLLITGKRAVFFTDFRYQEQVEKELPEKIEKIIDRNAIDRIVADKLVERGMTLGIQESYMRLAAFDTLKKKLRGVKIERTGSLVPDVTMIKTGEEIANIKKAANMAARVYRKVLEIARPGMRENELAMEISYLGRSFGSEGDAFDIIVASGPRGALPHGRAGTRKIRKGELVTIDFGCIYKGFNSDMTRTFAVGEPSEEARRIYEIVLRSEQKGVKAARAGMTGKDLDDVCRNEIIEAGYGEAFGHSTGHGLGIEVHEGPYVAQSGNEQVLKEGMVVTIEPGIYLPNRCGVRIEDDVAITSDGCTVLTSSPRKLIVV